MPSLANSPARSAWNNGSSSSPSEAHNPVRSPSATSPESLYERLARLEQYESERAQRVHIYETERSQLLSAFIRNCLNEIEDIKTRSATLTEYARRESKVVTLIDGNGLPFQDGFVQAGGQGGKPAAEALCDGVSRFVQHLRDRLPHNLRDAIPTVNEMKYVVRIYVDTQDLAETCLAAGIVNSIADVRDFLYAVGNSVEDFEVIDIGSDRTRVLKKISEAFKSYASDHMCQQILLGCAHDSSFIHIFDHLANTGLDSKVTLIEGPPLASEFRSLPFATEKFAGVFRDAGFATGKHKLQLFGNGNGSFASGISTSPGLMDERSDSRAASFSSSVATPSSTVTTPVFTWASAAKQAAILPDRTSTPPPKAIALAPGTIPRNRAGQRVDPISRTYDKKEVDRVKEIKMCNVHFLRQECRYGKDCTHYHDYKPTQSELGTLRLVARMAPCSYGSACEDLKCIYGHRCPAPAKSGACGGKNCIFGEDCRFPVELHGIDTTIVRSVVVR
ncbi:hypothetical protein EJ05DRAFT_17384 [Pseudovirgaria hyperparasitica]|uniref:C3H1-type domain-containing protein n=1 Tax=Pseudovirgaria hyperparasitica TaxID=470096 RepID=A0A6A6WKW9_9PEZI|nr:uncharacterized protein EJ05DRAFT_17384 [Pseudovirgaria hyperparasitica]KAF2762850.1 hypothetical protein EJ05DRAFT_17384 [Pseudovirgaria hyperparasitica]